MRRAKDSAMQSASRALSDTSILRRVTAGKADTGCLGVRQQSLRAPSTRAGHLKPASPVTIRRLVGAEGLVGL